MTRLTKHFTLEELTYSATAIKHGIDNTPNAEQIKNLKALAETLEEVRAYLSKKAGKTIPIYIKESNGSGYRNAAVNKLVNGVPNSDHMQGLAADITAPAFGNVKQVCAAIKESGIKLDQCINEYNKWVHIGVGKRMRNQHFKIG
ncbi:D-Ala-D-Ala carboxypeptidase family metallohydrolase [Oxalobacter sp. OttesenSCG-928-P03]|nr:D-Ala-D-Ala carboxypeptidase family metallohydrolase [Oxalobacter sp. OttesenSCG-928-P03]